MSIEVFPLPPSGPSLAEITSAITSNAAPATVTMPAITSSITTNATPFGGTWTDLGTHSTAGTTTVTFSNLSGYKYLRLLYLVTPSSASQVQRLRFNGDSGANYLYGNYVQGQSNTLSIGSSFFELSMATGSQQFGVIEIRGSNSTSIKKHVNSLTTAAGGNGGSFAGLWNNTAAITSLTFLVTSGNWSDIYINLIGAN